MVQGPVAPAPLLSVVCLVPTSRSSDAGDHRRRHCRVRGRCRGLLRGSLGLRDVCFRFQRDCRALSQVPAHAEVRRTSKPASALAPSISTPNTCAIETSRRLLGAERARRLQLNATSSECPQLRRHSSRQPCLSSPQVRYCRHSGTVRSAPDAYARSRHCASRARILACAAAPQGQKRTALQNRRIIHAPTLLGGCQCRCPVEAFFSTVSYGPVRIATLRRQWVSGARCLDIGGQWRKPMTSH